MKLFKNLDLSYESTLKYMIDIHLAMLLAIGVFYLIEYIENGYVVLLLGLWSTYLLMWTIYRFMLFTLNVDRELNIVFEDKLYQQISAKAKKKNIKRTSVVTTILEAHFDSKKDNNLNIEK